MVEGRPVGTPPNINQTTAPSLPQLFKSCERINVPEYPDFKPVD